MFFFLLMRVLHSMSCPPGASDWKDTSRLLADIEIQVHIEPDRKGTVYDLKPVATLEMAACSAILLYVLLVLLAGDMRPFLGIAAAIAGLITFWPAASRSELGRCGMRIYSSGT